MDEKINLEQLHTDWCTGVYRLCTSNPDACDPCEASFAAGYYHKAQTSSSKHKLWKENNELKVEISALKKAYDELWEQHRLLDDMESKKSMQAEIKSLKKQIREQHPAELARIEAKIDRLLTFQLANCFRCKNSLHTELKSIPDGGFTRYYVWCNKCNSNGPATYSKNEAIKSWETSQSRPTIQPKEETK